MGYRDDQDAILARSTALERELARAQREIADLKQSLGLRSHDPDDLPEAANVDHAEGDDRRVLAEGLMSRALGHAPSVKAPPPEPIFLTSAPNVDDAFQRGGVYALREALKRLLARRLAAVPEVIYERVEACADMETLVNWIVLLGCAEDGEFEVRLFKVR